jgi:putative spermidine/putrescine transport system permease protein
LKNKPQIFSITIFFAIAVLPVIAGFVYAVLYSIGLAGVYDTGFTLKNWAAILSSFELINSFLFSFYIAAVSISFALIISLWVVIKYGAHFDRGILSYIIYFPLSIPAIVAAFFIFQLLSKSGLISRIFFNLNLIDNINSFPDLINDNMGIGIILTHTLLAIPFFIIFLLGLYHSQSLENLKQLSFSLGANKNQTARKVLLPILLNKAYPTIILYFIFVLSSYEIPLLLGQQYPQMVSVFAVRKLQRFDLTDIPQAYVIISVYVFIVIVSLFILFRKRKLEYDFDN